MKKSNKSKCCVCGRYVDNELILMIDKKKYCPECGKERQKEKKDYKELMDYIYNLCHKDQTAMGLMVKQIKEYVETYEYKYGGILYTLKYAFELLEEPYEFIPDAGISFVPYLYHQAYEFCRQYYDLKQTDEELIDEVLSMPPIVYDIKRSQIIADDKQFWEEKRKGQGRSMLDMDDIEDDEDEDD